MPVHGHVYVHGSGEVTHVVDECVFDGTGLPGRFRGGGVEAFAGNLHVKQSQLMNLTAVEGGAVAGWLAGVAAGRLADDFAGGLG